MKRASLPLFLLLLVGLGLALWLFLAERPGTLRAGGSATVESAGLALEPAADRGLVRGPELAPMPEPARVRMEAAPSEHSSSSLSGPGHISGWVSRLVGKEEQGIPDVPIKLWRASGDRPLTADAQPIAETRTRTMGSFRFPDVASGSYFVGVEREGCARHFARVEVSADGPSRVLEFLLGSARVDGVVSALDGDARPTIELEAARRSRVETRWPDEDGRFAFEDLPAGAYHLRVHWRTHAPGSWREDSTRFELADGARLSYHLGDAVPLAHWRGRVSVAGGEPPRADAVLRFHADPVRREPDESLDARERAQPASFESDDAGRRFMLNDPTLRVRVGIGARGAFDVALPRTRWNPALEVDALSHRTCALGKQSLAGGDLTLDLVCPGSRVRGHVRGSIHAASALPLRVVGTQPDGGLDSSCYVAVGARDEFVLDGLEQGKWEFQPGPLPEDWKREPVPLEIGEEQRVFELDLWVRGP